VVLRIRNELPDDLIRHISPQIWEHRTWPTVDRVVKNGKADVPSLGFDCSRQRETPDGQGRQSAAGRLSRADGPMVAGGRGGRDCGADRLSHVPRYRDHRLSRQRGRA
jgi:hypothetical protein